MHGPDLLTSIGLCIAVAAALAFVAHRLRQPLLLAYLLAGVVIGPRIGLGLISDEGDIQTVAEIGLILLLFMIGLELDLRKLVSAGRAVLVTGALQVPLCVVLGLGFFAAIGFPIVAGDFRALYLSVCLSLSSTMIVVKLLYDKFELDTLPGRITLGVLIFQDIFAIIALGIQPNLANPEIGKVLVSLAGGAALVGAAFLISKYLLPPLFRSVAKLPELVLIGSLAWCFVVCAAASAAGLSREMGALIAGISISTFPYNLDVVAKVVSIRDFFVTLFFVALGMQIPMPTAHLFGMAALAALFLVASRFVVVFPILRALGLGHRASLLPAINLAQMSEFAMVIAAIGLGFHHIDQQTMSLLIFVFAFTAVASTYFINFSHPLQRVITAGLRRAGLRDIEDKPAQASVPEVPRDVVLLGFFTEASALVHEFEMASVEDRHPMLERLLVIDFNPDVHAELVRRGIACRYGDVANMDTLHHADVHDPKLVVSTIPDAILKGTTNLRLLKLARRLWPHAKVVVTANRAAGALQLYEAGADFVFVARLHSAPEMATILERGLAEGFERMREAQIEHMRRRNEVLQ
ncbi:MAG TPA: cation:proton antiporter [Casimicrobiaceae bacterium]|nr:cation:proton antiporter [Casimicrobiaceae bacterium]